MVDHDQRRAALVEFWSRLGVVETTIGRRASIEPHYILIRRRESTVVCSEGLAGPLGVELYLEGPHPSSDGVLSSWQVQLVRAATLQVTAEADVFRIVRRGGATTLDTLGTTGPFSDLVGTTVLLGLGVASIPSWLDDARNVRLVPCTPLWRDEAEVMRRDADHGLREVSTRLAGTIGHYGDPTRASVLNARRLRVPAALRRHLAASGSLAGVLARIFTVLDTQWVAISGRADRWTIDTPARVFFGEEPASDAAAEAPGNVVAVAEIQTLLGRLGRLFPDASAALCVELLRLWVGTSDRDRLGRSQWLADLIRDGRVRESEAVHLLRSIDADDTISADDARALLRSPRG